uniref:Uncharacterized protein n=1 Tax=Mycena chlorophos TaxID=658473 RepID=A0ABQ0LPB3_MYCCL|nr:predicted protein [Mycena chlorophos]
MPWIVQEWAKRILDAFPVRRRVVLSSRRAVAADLARARRKLEGSCPGARRPPTTHSFAYRRCLGLVRLLQAQDLVVDIVPSTTRRL